jgi:A/G-specific adenine glycosylase
MANIFSNSEKVEYLESAKIDWFHHQLKGWASQNLRDFPWRRTSDSYIILLLNFYCEKLGQGQQLRFTKH